MVGISIFGLCLLLWQSQIWDEAESMKEAQKIIDFRKSDPSCNELKRLYLAYYEDRYYSKHDWYWEVRDKLVKECVDKNQLDNIEFINTCKDFNYKTCNISKLENPELYEDFNFRTAIKDLKLKDGSGN